VNGWSEEQVEAHLDEATNLFLERSRHAWDLDLRALTDAGFGEDIARIIPATEGPEQDDA
jgi:hypothetical protein